MIPDVVAAALAGDSRVEAVEVEELRTGTGAATRGVARLHVTFSGAGVRTPGPLTLIRKDVEPLDGGPHAALAHDPRHWAYWKREPEAYLSGLLPRGSGMRAPRCYAVVGHTLYIEDTPGPRPSPARAVEALASWQVEFDKSLDRPWLATDQLGRRLAATTLDWDLVDADPRAIELWNRRDSLCRRLSDLPRVMSHGDFSIGNLVDTASGIVAFDWATLGWEPVGFDLAHLALSTGADPMPIYRASARRFTDEAEVGFRCALALIGVSRLHWMLSRSIPPPSWYLDFLWEQRPQI